MLITSSDNERVKKYIKLKQKKYREKYNEFIVEGEHLVLEAKRSGIVKEIILEKDEVIPLDGEKIYLPYEIIKKISTNENPPKVMALCEKKENEKELGNKILLIDGVQTPGNLGTIIRSAKAFNVDTIILSENTVDLYNPKVLRATQGMLFHINIYTDDLKEVIEKIKKEGIPVYTTNVNYGEDVRKLTASEKKRYALIIGNEAQGVRDEITDLADSKLYIKMNDDVESLNVGVATSILLYELGDDDE
ncbi:MAG: RNA methyltransferase [Bacilli bacterium]|nr:RNA methyltransferase [Bacilli bacterium]